MDCWPVIALTLLADVRGGAPAAGGPSAAPFVELRPVEAVVGDWIGHAVAADGDTILVSAHRARGVVHAYRRGRRGWTSEAVLAPQRRLGFQFGYSVAVQGDTAIVGYSNGRAAHAFERQGGGAWLEVGLLELPATAPDRLFGRRIALDGDVALVGAAGGHEQPGAVHAFERGPGGAWRWADRLVPGDSHGDDRFGAEIALSESRALISSAEPQRAPPFERAVHAFERDASGRWSQAQRLAVVASDRRPQLGRALAMVGEHALVSDSSLRVANAALSGAVRVMHRGPAGWLEGDVLVGSGPVRGRRQGFGHRLAARGDLLVVAAEPSGSGRPASTVFVFERRPAGQFRPVIELASPSGQGGDAFGASLAIGDGFIVVGAPLTVPGPGPRDPSLGGNDAVGSAWVIERDDLDRLAVAAGGRQQLRRGQGPVPRAR